MNQCGCPVGWSLKRKKERRRKPWSGALWHHLNKSERKKTCFHDTQQSKNILTYWRYFEILGSKWKDAQRIEHRKQKHLRAVTCLLKLMTVVNFNVFLCKLWPDGRQKHCPRRGLRDPKCTLGKPSLTCRNPFSKRRNQIWKEPNRLQDDKTSFGIGTGFTFQTWKLPLGLQVGERAQNCLFYTRMYNLHNSYVVFLFRFNSSKGMFQPISLLEKQICIDSSAAFCDPTPFSTYLRRRSHASTWKITVLRGRVV